jgi:hypothetical protein
MSIEAPAEFQYLKFSSNPPLRIKLIEVSKAAKPMPELARNTKPHKIPKPIFARFIMLPSKKNMCVLSPDLLIRLELFSDKNTFLSANQSSVILPFHHTCKTTK